MIGAHGAGETPDTIPNSEAKPSSGDDTPSGESSTVPNYSKRVLTGSFTFRSYGYERKEILLMSGLFSFCT